jgi:hypothetical protein
MKKFKSYNTNDYNTKRLDYLLNFKGQQNRSFSENMKSMNETIKDNTVGYVKNLLDEELNKLEKQIDKK